MIFKICFLLISCISISHSDGNFWHISDFHLDPLYSVDGNRHFLCHQDKTAPKDQLNKYGDYLCDSPMALVESAIQEMSIIDKVPDFIIWTGDNAPHYDCDWSKIFQILNNITTTLRKYFAKTIPILPVIGNHDTFPANQIPSNNQTIYNDYLSKGGWDMLDLPKETFLKGGYFSVNVKPKLRVLSLNTILWYLPNTFTKGQFDPAGQFEWMKNQLEDAKDNDVKVYLIGHVPPGQDDYASNRYIPELYNQYLSIIKTYQQQIAGQFFGHLHLDSFRLFLNNKGNTFGSILLASSVAPWHSPTTPSSIPINPSIRSISYNTSSFLPLDYKQYYLNISNLQPQDTPKWELLYQFSKEYKTPDLSGPSLLNTFSQLVKNKTKLDSYLNHMTAGLPQKDVHSHTLRLKRLCELVNIEKHDYDDCFKVCNEHICDKPKDYFPFKASQSSTSLSVIQIIFIVLVAFGLITLVLFLGYKKVKKIREKSSYDYARF